MPGYDSTEPVSGMFMFTFGADARMTVRGEGTEDGGEGVPIGNRYVLVRASTETTARDRFIEVFGPGRFAECRAYDSAGQRLVRRRNMIVLVATLVAA
jgi:hypothetical protein